MNAKLRVLIVEDEPEIRRFLRVTLSAHGFEPVEATRAAEAMARVEEQLPDLIILDLGLPDMDGVEVTSRLREWTSVPIIVLSVRNLEKDKIEALDAGADDYMTKPFGVFELLARIRVALRHAEGGLNRPEESSFTTGELEVDLLRRIVKVKGEEVHLTPTEYKLLTILIRDAGKVVGQQALLREVWGPGYAKKTHYLRVYMGNLRHKVEKQPARPQCILTEPGVGYRLRVD
ncbi:MAG: response regulator [Candidatus Obscuribacterales bacterium]|nr:response regulator [Candidatus Obscuribacterales bacterium]